MRIFGLRSEVISFHQEIDEGGRDKHAKASGVSAPVEAGNRFGESGEHEESGAPENSAEQAITWPASEPRRLPTCRYRLPSRRQCRRLSLSPPTHTKAGAFYLRPSLNLSSTSMMPSSLLWTPEGSSSAATSSTTPTSLTIPELSSATPLLSCADRASFSPRLPSVHSRIATVFPYTPHSNSIVLHISHAIPSPRSSLRNHANPLFPHASTSPSTFPSLRSLHARIPL
ncbi:hypothetical protein V8E36_007535 [Tilletia maclaganii]